MKTHKSGTKSSTLLTTQLRKKGLELVPESVDPALGLGPVFTVNPLKSGTSNSDVAYRLYYAGESSKYSASHRNAVIKAAAKKQRETLAGARAGAVVAKKGLKLEVVDDLRCGDTLSERVEGKLSETSAYGCDNYETQINKHAVAHEALQAMCIPRQVTPLLPELRSIEIHTLEFRIVLHFQFTDILTQSTHTPTPSGLAMVPTTGEVLGMGTSREVASSD
ncbi:uncharacterized protein A1O9_07440 [Exophiala aquamarina CBS 119918]|uniref:Uncharacterized protein n=1 Tax=Exophiala aquamarina CBS 119918 TaxID=1182545 RepID=A0A072PK30_9EURO|nr:uncharacterized protein A1O9_07440 [Exophiala aquamarina CBS 119918]KEF55860.1 hypothetical protein A1O9_07440 [Exophiala aquamarina CBS 119918]